MSAIFPILAIITALAATVLAFIFIVPEKNNRKKFGALLHNTCNFKFLIIEKIMQALYIFSTAFAFVFGFFMLFYVEKTYDYHYSYYSGGYYTAHKQWMGWYGILIMILAPIAIRIAFEMIMMFLLLVKNVIQINNKLGSNLTETPATTEAPAEAAPVASNEVCEKCGNAYDANNKFCPYCGASK